MHAVIMRKCQAQDNARILERMTMRILHFSGRHRPRRALQVENSQVWTVKVPRRNGGTEERLSRVCASYCTSYCTSPRGPDNVSGGNDAHSVGSSPQGPLPVASLDPVAGIGINLSASTAPQGNEPLTHRW